MELFDLSGRTAIVTGGDRGIGFAIARGLAGAGASVVIANRKAAEGESAAESLRKEGLNAAAVPTDVSSLPSIADLVAKVMKDFGKIDVLVNNAAIVIRKPAEEYTEEDWDNIMNTNLKGLFFCSQFVGREMIKRKQGKIINLSSVVSQVAQRQRSVYAISKAGISHLTRAFALEWAEHKINVNAIGPGLTITDINKKYFEAHPEELKQFVGDIPMGREGYPSDIVGAAIFLASEASDFITGQTLLVDGGMTLA